tara:strand:- start:197 stop:508 length:312 start_codon:yes stop_codon:yes gene_type:complete
MAVLPFYLATFPMFLSLSFLNRIISLFLRKRTTEVRIPVSFTRGIDIDPKKKVQVPDGEWSELLEDSDIWDAFFQSPYAFDAIKTHLEHCLDYSISDQTDVLP